MSELHISLLLAFMLGTIVGSFLNVCIYRLHTGRSLNGRSHCMSCGTQLRWYELLPIVSFIVLRARCRTCSASVPLRYLVVELLTGVTFLFLGYVFTGAPLLFLLNAVLLSLLIVIAVYDVRHTIIPDELTLAVGTLAIIFVVTEYAREGHMVASMFDVLSGIGAGGFFFLLWYMSSGRWVGLGDAKLAVPLGIILGTGALSMVVLSFWIGAATSLFLLFSTRLFTWGKTFLPRPLRGLTMRSEIPFAPFLISGFVCAYYLHANIFDITARLFPF